MDPTTTNAVNTIVALIMVLVTAGTFVLNSILQLRMMPRQEAAKQTREQKKDDQTALAADYERLKKEVGELRTENERLTKTLEKCQETMEQLQNHGEAMKLVNADLKEEIARLTGIFKGKDK